MMIKLMWLAILLGGGTWWVRRDVAAYHAFAMIEDSVQRQHILRRWIGQSFAILVGGSVISLWIAGALWPFDGFPAMFEPLHQQLQPSHRVQSSEGGIGFAVGVAGGLAVLLAVQWRRLRKMLEPVSGPADAMIPRNRREAGLVLLLSLNAGFSEELFFRLALPLFLFALTGSLAFAIAGSVVLFGMAHAYQGWKGIAATMLAGGLLTLVYLSHGSLLRVMVIHALIDVVAFFVRPALTRWLARLYPAVQSPA